MPVRIRFLILRKSRPAGRGRHAMLIRSEIPAYAVLRRIEMTRDDGNGAIIES